MKKSTVKKCTVSDKLIADGWFHDRQEIVPWVMAGKVLADDRLIKSVAEKIPQDAKIRIREYYKTKYVNKGGLKLEHALSSFRISVKGRVALDCGASTGGFTDCLINSGAEKVYAVDAGHGQLAQKLIHNPKIVNMEKTNISDACLACLEPRPDLLTLDLSYLSLSKAISICKNILLPGGEIVALVKPIYEVESSCIKQSGEINVPEIHKEILHGLCEKAKEEGYTVCNITNSPIKGNSGVIEYFAHLFYGDRPDCGENLDLKIEQAVKNGFELEKFNKTFDACS